LNRGGTGFFGFVGLSGVTGTFRNAVIREGKYRGLGMTVMQWG